MLVVISVVFVVSNKFVVPILYNKNYFNENIENKRDVAPWGHLSSL